jgi:GNAT superfamily N-acetyltransferase
VIRRSGTDEAETQFAIQRAACLPALAHVFPPDLYPFPDEEVRRRWQEFDGVVLVSEREGEPVGIAGVSSCWLHGFYVLPEWWGRGVADELHAAALEAMADCAELKLWVLEENHRARRFYRKRGWRQNGETRVVPYPPSPLDLGYSYVRAEP